MATFGDTGSGGSVSYQTANVIIVCKYTLSEAGLVSKLTLPIQGENVAGTQALKAVAYVNSAGVPGALVASSNEVVYDCTVVGPTVTDFTLAAPVTFPAADYFLGLFYGTRSAAGHASLLRNAGAVNQVKGKDPSGTYPNAQDPFGTASYSLSWTIRVYATYTAAGGSPPFGNERRSARRRVLQRM